MSQTHIKYKKGYLIGDLIPLHLAHLTGKVLEGNFVPVQVGFGGFELAAVIGGQIVLHALQEGEHIFLGPTVCGRGGETYTLYIIHYIWHTLGILRFITKLLLANEIICSACNTISTYLGVSPVEFNAPYY